MKKVANTQIHKLHSVGWQDVAPQDSLLCQLSGLSFWEKKVLGWDGMGWDNLNAVNKTRIPKALLTASVKGK